jgi:NAD(P)-dependent dehydrogenase (short-subunit alcohol dehydrogenase family)
LQKRNATVAVIGAGDFIGGEIAKKFASEGFTVFAGRRNGAKLEPLVKEIEATGGEIHARSLDARKEEEISAFLADADKHAPLEVCIFNIGANVNFPILETTERVFRKVWEMACYSGFLAGREAARLMLPRGQGNIFFTGATASLRGGSLCQRQIRPPGRGAGDGARARAGEHPRCASHHRFRRRYRMGAAAAPGGAGSQCTR